MMQTADKAQEVCDCLNWEVYLATLYSKTQDTNNVTPTQKLLQTTSYTTSTKTPQKPERQ